MGKAVEEKREWHRIWSKSKTEANKMVYNQMKKYAGKVVSLAMPVARGVRLVRLNPPLASQGGSTGSIHHIRYSIHTPYTIHRTPQARNRTPQLARGVRLVRYILYIEPPSWSWGFGKWGPENRTNYPPSNLRNINDYPPSKSARKIAPTTPPRIYGTSTTTPPSKSAWKIAPTTPPRIYGTSSTTPPPRNRTPLFKTLATALLAKESYGKKFSEMLDNEAGKGNLFKTVKRIVRQNRDVVGISSMKNDKGGLVTDESEIREVWSSYFEKLLNEEFEWNRDFLKDLREEGSSSDGPVETITEEEVRTAIKQMKKGKAAGPSGVTVEMLQAAGEAGIRWVTEICNAILKEGKVPSDWERSWIVSVYKGKGDALECGSYRGIKLLDQVMKVMERVIEKRVRSIVLIDKMQFGFRPGRGTTDAIFIVRQLQEKYLGRKRELWMAFLDLEKAFDRVPREVVWWALGQMNVDRSLINVIMSMYKNARASVKVNGVGGRDFPVEVGVHQGSVLSPLLFIIVMEALSRTFSDRGLPWELLYADDLVLLADTEDELKEKLQRWKSGLERKGLRVNVGKTKVMKCGVGLKKTVDSGKYPCGVCGKGVKSNSIQCTVCIKWVHKRCSGISKKLRAEDEDEFKCRKCDNGGNLVHPEAKFVELDDGSKFECVDKFCYLGDMLSAGGGAEEAAKTRVRSAWGKFNELAPILTKRGASMKLKGRIYDACVQRVLVYGSETWGVKAEDLAKLMRTERMMVRRMCGVSLKDRKRSDELLSHLGIECVEKKIQRGRLRWFGHVERKNEEDWVKKCTKLNVDGMVGRGAPRKMWRKCVDEDMRSMGIKVCVAQDRCAWRNAIRGPTRASADALHLTLVV